MAKTEVPTRQLFVCTNQRVDGASCGAKGSVQLREQLKSRCKEALGDQAKQLRVSASGCLGQCQEGIASVLYPADKWLLGFEAQDAELIFKLLKNDLLKKEPARTESLAPEVVRKDGSVR